MSVSSTQFALDLLRSSSDSSSNFVISPFSLGSALAIVHDGAKDDTQSELTQLLAKDHSPEEVTALYSKLSNDLSSTNSEGVTTAVANRFFLDQSFDLLSEYAEHVDKTYGTGVEKIEFSDGQTCADRINGFVNEKTEEMIPELVNADMFQDAAAILVNAVYFKGQWEKTFEPEKTLHKTFYGINGDRDIPFMCQNISTRYSISPDFTAVSLPYKDTIYSLVILMPSSDFSSWREELSADSLLYAMKELQKRKIKLELPKFQIESETDGKASLEKCGVTKLFSSEANLSGISSGPLHVSKIVHKAVIDVSEEGTEAAAATGLVMDKKCLRRSKLEEITINRPFLYTIVRGNEDILFIGQYC